jgi:hypothetical protein
MHQSVNWPLAPLGDAVQELAAINKGPNGMLWYELGTLPNDPFTRITRLAGPFSDYDGLQHVCEDTPPGLLASPTMSTAMTKEFNIFVPQKHIIIHTFGAPNAHQVLQAGEYLLTPVCHLEYTTSSCTKASRPASGCGHYTARLPSACRSSADDTIRNTTILYKVMANPSRLSEHDHYGTPVEFRDYTLQGRLAVKGQVPRLAGHGLKPPTNGLRVATFNTHSLTANCVAEISSLFDSCDVVMLQEL